ncbi:YdcF family protein [Pseudodesulfovibrio sp. zrk46]|uniref:YdcF family protein n=1 Tax=Pseudodesulfovibrio sp. zrk46 TaxID=2725288 RepID=UPI001449EF43|nr:YdcF family protein [Pseudodesulfovibrio sp. zrk46]QJB57593.1 YdcF family protein [Pseudodesulfovibrio sp. zrk46]
MGKLIRLILQMVGALTILGALATFILLAFAGSWMKVNDSPIKADYILPLAGDQHRMLKAIEFYKQGYAPIILISNALKRPPSPLQQLHWEMGYPNYSREEYYSRLIPLLGINNIQLEEFGHGHISTMEEAEALKKHLKGKNKRLLIVTSPYHARRAKMIFMEILPDCDIVVASTEIGSFKKKWWTDQISAQTLVMEFAKTLHYLLGGVFRSTDEAT